jgi:hypothetical protein
MISFFCPYCKHVSKAPLDYAGALIACQQCKLDIRVPNPAAAEPPSAVPPTTRLPASSSWWKRFLRRGEIPADANR